MPRKVTLERYLKWVELEEEFQALIDDYERDANRELPKDTVFHIVLRNLRRDIQKWRSIFVREWRQPA